MTIRPELYDHRKPLFIQPGEHEGKRWFFRDAAPIVQRPGYPQWMARNKCAIESCNYAGGYLKTNLCEECAWKVWVVFTNADELPRAETMQDYYNKYLDEIAETEVINELTIVDAPKAATIKNNAGHVYYHWVGGLIKIGYTQNIERRIKQYPPHSKLLAVHPGTMRTERQMHSKFFNSIVKGKEWFAITPALTDHIHDVRAKFTDHPVESMDILKAAA